MAIWDGKNDDRETCNLRPSLLSRRHSGRPYFLVYYNFIMAHGVRILIFVRLHATYLSLSISVSAVLYFAIEEN